MLRSQKKEGLKSRNKALMERGQKGRKGESGIKISNDTVSLESDGDTSSLGSKRKKVRRRRNRATVKGGMRK